MILPPCFNLNFNTIIVFVQEFRLLEYVHWENESCLFGNISTRLSVFSWLYFNATNRVNLSDRIGFIFIVTQLFVLTNTHTHVYALTGHDRRVNCSD